MRRVAHALVVVVVAACGSAASRGPAWPKLHATELDGGETLAPRQTSAISESEVDTDVAPAKPEVPLTPERPVDKPSSTPAPAASSPTPPSLDDVLFAPEDITIEIDD